MKPDFSQTNAANLNYNIAMVDGKNLNAIAPTHARMMLDDQAMRERIVAFSPVVVSLFDGEQAPKTELPTVYVASHVIVSPDKNSVTFKKGRKETATHMLSTPLVCFEQNSLDVIAVGNTRQPAMPHDALPLAVEGHIKHHDQKKFRDQQMAIYNQSKDTLALFMAGNADLFALQLKMYRQHVQEHFIPQLPGQGDKGLHLN